MSDHPTMDKATYLEAIKRLGLSQVRAGRAFGLSPRQSQRIATGESPVPRPVSKLLKIVEKYEIPVQEVEDM